MEKAYTIDQQITKLKSNGMTFDDEEKAKEILLDVGYFILSLFNIQALVAYHFPQIA